MIFGLAVFALTVFVPSAHAKTNAPDTQYDSVIEYSTSSAYTPTNVNFTWTDSNSCGSFGGFGPAATTMASYCFTAGTGVTIVAFWAQAYDAAGTPSQPRAATMTG